MKDLLEEIYKTQALTSTRLAKKLFGDPLRIDEVRKFFFVVNSVGVKLLPDFEISTLRLRRGIVIVNDLIIRDLERVESAKLDGVRSIVPLIPKGVMLTVEGGSILDRDGHDYSIRVFRYEHFYRARPRRDLLFPIARGVNADKIRYVLSVLDRCDLIEFPKTTAPKRFDWIDLEIIDLVTTDPCITMRKLVSELRYQRVGRRVRRFVDRVLQLERAITGYGISRIRALKVAGFGIVAVMRGPSIVDALRLLRVPIVISIGVSDESSIAVVQLVTLRKLYFDTIQALYDFCSVYGLELLDVYCYDPRLVVVNRFIRRSTGEYFPSMRVDESRWVRVNIDRVIESIRRVAAS